MMTMNQVNERKQMEMVTIDQLVPYDYLVRKASVRTAKIDSAPHLARLSRRYQ